MKRIVVAVMTIVLLISPVFAGYAVAYRLQPHVTALAPTRWARANVDALIPPSEASTNKSEMELAVEQAQARKAEEERRAQEAAQQAQAAQAAQSRGGGPSGGGGGSYDEQAEAEAILAGIIAEYPILAGSWVSFGDALGYEAVAYYRSGHIVISPTHTYDLYTLIYHEAMHILDWREDGDIDNDDR